jgi:hypothetical protein|tara:strand:+ start:207 stop:428 length:222 start_codon:yes stop_codon:yes gene_type:complete
MDEDISPSYYKGKELELCDVLLAFNCDFLMGNVIKYAIRFSQKNDKGGIKALRKAKWYIERMIEEELKNGKTN